MRHVAPSTILPVRHMTAAGAVSPATTTSLGVSCAPPMRTRHSACTACSSGMVLVGDCKCPSTRYIVAWEKCVAENPQSLDRVARTETLQHYHEVMAYRYSTYFLGPKKTGDWTPILNLK